MKRFAAGLGTSLLVSLLVTGCATSPSGPRAPTTRLSPAVDPASATVGHNKTATRLEAQRLLALAPIPTGATPLSGPQPTLSGPAMGTPATASLIDLHRFWRVAMPLAAVDRYLKAHAPVGLTVSGSSSGASGGVSTEGIAWDEANRSYAQGLQLDVALASDGNDTLVRADGMGEWIDPRPTRDAATGPRMRVTVAGGCPASDRGEVGVGNSRPGLSTRLLPAAAPLSALICVYGGLNPPHVFGLRAHVALKAPDARLLAAQARAVPLGHTDGDTTSCPADDGSFDLVVFHYASGPDVDLGDHATGCGFLANGRIVAAGGLNLRRWVRPTPF
jgi:hypothetical protein